MKDLIARLSGIVTVLNTPFTAADAVDIDSLQRNIESALDAGAAGFLVPALASEVGKLTESERARLVRAALDAAAGRCIVIGGASAPDAAARRRLAAWLIDAGCDGILASIPYADDAQYAQDAADLAALGPGFLMLQDFDPQGYGLPLPLILRLFETIPAFRSIKIEVVPAGVKYTALLEATHGALHVAGGWAVQQMIEALDRGVHTLMPTGMHAVYTHIWRLYARGDRAGARALFERLLPVLAFSNQHLDISIHFFKRLMHRQGLFATDRVRPPILPFDSIHARIADELIDLAIALTEECRHDLT